MKKMLCLGLSLILMNGAQASSNCQNLLVVDSVKIKTILKNTAHDRFGESDEIQLELSSSIKKLKEEKLFSDLLGITTYKQAPLDSFGYSRTDVRFYESKITSNQEIKHELLYGRYLNIVMVDEDIEVPLASGSIEVPFHFAAGGNHDDLIFAKSIKLDLSNQKGENLSITNDSGDELEIQISPSVVKKSKRLIVQENYKQLRADLDRISVELRQAEAHSMKAYELNKQFNATYGKASYLKDLLDGKIENSCAN